MVNLIFDKLFRKRSFIILKRISQYLDNSRNVIDIGSGTGDVCCLLQQQGKNVTPVDVANFHGPRLVKTTIYDGKTLPFKDKSFDTALLLMVMHHTPDPEVVFKEAARVAKNIIVIETSYTNKLNRFFTIISDAIGNLRLEAFWGLYKTDEKWRKFFSQHGFKIKASKKFLDRNFGFIPFLHLLYYLVPQSHPKNVAG